MNTSCNNFVVASITQRFHCFSPLRRGSCYWGSTGQSECRRKSPKIRCLPPICTLVLTVQLACPRCSVSKQRCGSTTRATRNKARKKTRGIGKSGGKELPSLLRFIFSLLFFCTTLLLRHFTN